MSKTRFIELLSKKEAGEISLAEQKELQNFMLQNEDMHRLFSYYEEEWQAYTNQSNTTTQESDEQQWQALKNNIKYHTSSKKHPKVYRLLQITIAASILIASYVGINYFLHNQTANNQPTQNIVSTKKGSKSNIILPDGTQVVLNADSKITYNKKFGENNREVVLIGEAFFDVVKDPLRPFIVHTKGLDIKVLGTAFNVKAYNSDNTTEATLLRGKIEVLLNNNSNRSITLKPNEKIIVKNTASASNKKNEAEITPDITISSLKTMFNPKETIVETEWTKNRLVFDKQTLKEIKPLIERWFNVEIEISGDLLNNDRKYTASFEGESIHDVLDVLKDIGNLKYKINEKSILIYNKQ